MARGHGHPPITFTSAMTTTQAGQLAGHPGGRERLRPSGLLRSGLRRRSYYKNIPALNTSASDVQVRHTRLHDNGVGWRQDPRNECGAPSSRMSASSAAAATASSWAMTVASAQVKPTWDGGVISGSGKSGIFMSRYASAALQPTFRNLTIANNKGDGIVIEWNGPVPTFENVAHHRQHRRGHEPEPRFLPVYRNLTLSGNGTDAVVIPGGSSAAVATGGRASRVCPTGVKGASRFLAAPFSP